MSNPSDPADRSEPRWTPSWEPTTPAPTSPPPAPQVERTTPMPVLGPPPPPPTSAPTRPPAHRPAGKGRFGFAAGVLAAALFVGGGAGVGGAAAYSAWRDDPTATSETTESGGAASPVVLGGDASAAEGSVEQVAEAVLPSVVKLDVAGAAGGAQSGGSGSGIIISSDGLILTNEHVAGLASDSGRITVSFHDGTRASATVVGTDPLTDTAVIQAEDVADLTPATIGESGAVAVGEEVVAIGSPFGLDATVTSGIVSALDRPVDVGSDGQGNSTVYPAIQTDAAINPGNSGGPLVNMAGQVVGINSSIRTSSGGDTAGSIGLGFAIPIDEVLPIIDQLKAGEDATHARLGISVRDAAADEGALVADGAQIQEINSDSAAGEAGLQDGDVITRIDDTLITGSDSLVATIRSYRPGDEVEVTYERDGEEQTTTVTLESDAETS